MKGWQQWMCKVTTVRHAPCFNYCGMDRIKNRTAELYTHVVHVSSSVLDLNLKSSDTWSYLGELYTDVL